MSSRARSNHHRGAVREPPLTPYEQLRANNIARNVSMLATLGVAEARDALRAEMQEGDAADTFGRNRNRNRTAACT